MVGTIHIPPNQTYFMESFNENLSKVDTNNVETYILGDLNINIYLWQNGHYVSQKHNLLSCHSVPYDVKNYVDTSNVETYILGDFNINLWQNGHYVFQKHNLLSCHSVANDVKSYFDFCTMFGLKQLIESPTRITCSIPFIMDHILASFLDRVTQRRILNFALSDHQLIYCTRKITRKREMIISK